MTIKATQHHPQRPATSAPPAAAAAAPRRGFSNLGLPRFLQPSQSTQVQTYAQAAAPPQASTSDLDRHFHLPHGSFHVDMEAISAGGWSRDGLAHLMGTIQFDPDPLGPYANDIGLVQAARVQVVGGWPWAPQLIPADWSGGRDANGQPREAEWERNIFQTPGPTSGQGLAPQGWLIDGLPSIHQQGQAHLPDYSASGPAADNPHGWVRGLADVGPARLWDAPGTTRDADFSMETVARADDTLQVYGSLQWGFRVRDGEIEGVYARASEQATAAFGEALERFRGYYAHEPFSVYFDQGCAQVPAGQDTALRDVPDYLRRYPDVSLQLLGVAADVESPGGAVVLAGDRALAVRDLLRQQGMPSHTQVLAWGRGEASVEGFAGPTDQLALAGTAAIGTVVAPTERKVDVSFEHSLCGVPIRMPWGILPGSARP
jgi:outer membrane protein OmpA-like peptidoglycan-associated protein